MRATRLQKTRAARRREPGGKVASSTDSAHVSFPEIGRPQHTALLLAASALPGCANLGMRAVAIQQLQHIHGNRAVQHYLQRISDATTAPVINGGLARRIATRAGAGDSLEPGERSRLDGIPGADLSGMSSLRIQRDGPKPKKPSYRPKVTRSPDKIVRGINEWVEVKTSVTNAGSAPHGTDFQWDWDWDADDSKVLIPDDVRPKAGPKATLRAKTKAVGTTDVDPIVDYSLPSEAGDPLLRFESTATVRVTVPPPKADFFTVLTHGGQSPGTPRRDGTCFMGDEFYVSATFSGIDKPQYNSLDVGVRGSSPRFTQSVQWKGDKLIWILKADKVGKSKLEFWVKVPGMVQELKHVEDMTTLLDLQHFHMAVTSAQSKAGAKLGNAASKIHAAAASYERAYDAQQDILTHKAKEDQLRQDLALGALFAVLGGAAGGAVGNLVKEALGKPMADLAKGGALIDMTKDLVKFSVRTLPKLGGGGGGGAQTGETSETPGGGGPEIAQKGENKAAGEKPSQMLYRFEGMIGADQAKVQTALHEVIDAALTRSSEANFRGEFDEDPREIVDRDVTIDQIAQAMVADDKEYARKLWHAWLPGNVQKGLWRQVDPFPGMRYWSPRAWLEAAAAQCGEDVDSWLASYWPQGLQVKGPGPSMNKM